MSFIKKLILNFKYKYSPTIPDLDFNDFESRRNWILFMAHRTGRFPVREVYDKFVPHVTRQSANTDLKRLEEAGLIKREKDHGQKSYVIPLFDDAGEEVKNAFEQRKEFWLNFGLPILTVFLLIVLFAIHAS